MVSVQGEIDIVEGVNSKEPNQSTLHTSASKYFDSRIDLPSHPPRRLCHAILSMDDWVRLSPALQSTRDSHYYPFQNERWQ